MPCFARSNGIVHAPFILPVGASALSALSHQLKPLLLPRRPRRKNRLLRPLPPAPTSPRRSLRILLLINLLHNPLNLLCLQHLDLVPRRHDRDLNILSPGLHDFEQGLDGQFDRVGAVEVGGVVAFEEFADGFAGAADGVCFPVGGCLLALRKPY